MTTYSFAAPLWRHTGEAAWYFVTLPEDIADEIDEVAAAARRGFGSVRVEATVGGSTWRTSIFPDTKAASYLLPVKRAIRVAEGVDDGDRLRIELAIVDGG